MITIRVLAQVESDRRVVLVLPPDVPLGRNELTVSITPATAAASREPRSNLADWADAHAEHWGTRLSAADVESFTGRGV